MATIQLPSGKSAEIHAIDGAKSVYISPIACIHPQNSGLAVGPVEELARWISESDVKLRRVIVSTAKNASYDMSVARKHNCSIIIDGIEIDLPSMTDIDYSLTKMRHETDETGRKYTSEAVVRALKAEIPRSMRARDAAKLIAQASHSSMPSGDVKNKLFDEMSQFRESALRMVYPSKYTEVNSIDDTRITDAINAGGAIALGLPMGAGKTSAIIKPLIAKKEAAGLRTICITPKRLIVDELARDDQHYSRIKIGSEHGALTLVTVINSLPKSRWSRIREDVDTVVIDEIDEVLQQIAGDAVDGGMQAREAMLDALRAVIRTAKTVVVADAGLNDSAVKFLRDCGKEPKVFWSLPLPNRIVRHAHSSDHALALDLIKQDVDAGLPVAVITDVSSNSLDGYIATVGHQDKHIRIDAGTSKTTPGILAGGGHSIDGYDIAWITPVVSSGVSITSDYYKRVYILSCGTVTPVQLLQMTARFRSVKDVVLATQDRRAKPNETHPMSIGMKLLMKDHAIDKYVRQLDTMSGTLGFCVQKRLEAALQRADYSNIILQLLRITCHRMIKIDLENVDQKAARVALKAGKSMAKAERHAAIKAAPVMSDTEADKLDDDGRITREEELQLTAHKIRKCYSIDTITDDVLDFDRDGLGRGEVSVVRELRESVDGDAEKARKYIGKLLFATLKVSTMTWTGEYTPEAARSFVTAALVQKVTLTGVEMTVAKAIPLVYDDVRFDHKKSAMSVVGQLLKTYGHKQVKTGRSVRVDGRKEHVYMLDQDIAARLESYVSNRGCVAMSAAA